VNVDCVDKGGNPDPELLEKNAVAFLRQQLQAMESSKKKKRVAINMRLESVLIRSCYFVNPGLASLGLKKLGIDGAKSGLEFGVSYVSGEADAVADATGKGDVDEGAKDGKGGDDGKGGEGKAQNLKPHSFPKVPVGEGLGDILFRGVNECLKIFQSMPEDCKGYAQNFAEIFFSKKSRENSRTIRRIIVGESV
jgi:hypothetical protein